MSPLRLPLKMFRIPRFGLLIGAGVLLLLIGIVYRKSWTVPVGRDRRLTDHPDQPVPSGPTSSPIDEEPIVPISDQPTDIPSILRAILDRSIELILLDSRMFADDFLLLNETARSDETQPNRVLTFGLFEKDQSNFELLHKRSLSNYRLISTRGLDYRKMRARKMKSSTKEHVQHYFLLLDSNLLKTVNVLHFAVVFPRSEFYWLGSLEESIVSPQYRFLFRLNFPITFPMAVEKFECKKHALRLTELSSVADFCAPSDMGLYEWQLSRSKFVECHYHDVVYPFRAKFPRMQHHDDYTNTSESMREIMRISKLHRVTTMLSCGTILGWYRQCDFIPESKDLDTTIQIEEYNYGFFKDIFNSKILNLVLRIGSLDDGLEFRTYGRKGGVWLDVFGLYKKGENATKSFMWNNYHWYESTYPLIRGVCSAELFGILVYVPCNYEEFVLADYGPHGWFVPYTGGGYANINIERLWRWDETEESFLYYRYVKGGCEDPDELWGCDERPKATENSTMYKKYLAKRKGVTTSSTSTKKVK